MHFRKLLPAAAALLLAPLGLTALTPANADSLTEPAKTNVTIHMLQLDITPGAASAPNDGRLHTAAELSADLGTTVTALPGTVFEYWKINDANTLGDLNAMSLAELSAAYTSVQLPATDANGTVTVGALDSYDAGQEARYYFRQIVSPANVQTTASPFLLGLPLMNTEGTAFLTDVHLYPKSVTVYGKVELTKLAGYGAPLENAQFKLYKGTPADPFNPEDPGTEYAAGTTYSSDENGLLSVSGLPYGDYYFVETVAPTGFLLNPAPVKFQITVSEATNVTKVTKVNWLKPHVHKWVTASEQTEGSAGYNQDLTWVLEPVVPGNISTYSDYTITDTLDPALTYTGNLKIKVGPHTLVQDTHYTVSAPTGDGGTLQISLTPAALQWLEVDHKIALSEETSVTFTTKINNKAVMGAGIPNKAVVNYNDGIAAPGSATSELAYAYTGGKTFLKVAETEDGTPLAGAKFKVATDSAATHFVKDPTTGADLVLTSDANGKFSVKGLKFDPATGTDYYLVETVAPVVGDTPYQLLQSPVAFKVTKTSFYENPALITDPNVEPTAEPDQIVNNTGFQIPLTGGLGTGLFTIGGLILMAGAVWLTRRKKGTTA